MTKFSDLKLDPKVLQAIAEAGYENPTPIQAGAIPPALEGRDVLGIAQTGTGKTAGFVLPMITLLGRGRARARMPRSLVLCPTRELAAQVAENFDTYAKHTRLTKALLIGGVSFGEQDKLIDRGVDVLIATPGRLLDHFERGKLLLTGVQIMVVDEADRMLDMGFIPDIERIFQLTPFTRQTLFFSATMAPEIERITDTFLHAPERIEVARQATASETITQRLVELTPTRKDQTAKQKRELLRALIDAEGDSLKNAIIFCNRKTDVDIVAKSLKAHGYDAAPIHGDLDQRVRMATLDGFREGTLRFLVASDVAARGLDIPAVSHVINFDLPSHAEDYVHRIGRTGRAGREGTAISIATPADEKYLSSIESLIKQALPRGSAPEGFRLSDAAQKPPRPASERGNSRGAPTRTRSRRAAPRDESASKETVAAVETQVAEERPAERAAEPRKANGNGSRHEGRGPEREDHRGADRRDDRREAGRDDRRERYRDRDRGPAVMGMGDHTPDFLLTSFSDALAMTEKRMAAGNGKAAAADQSNAQPQAEEATTSQAVSEDQTTAGAEVATDQPAAKPTRSRSRRSRSSRAAVQADTEAEQNAAEQTAGDQTAAEDKPAEVPQEGAEPAASEEGKATAEQPSEAATGTETEAAPAEAEPAKPARKPRATRSRRKPAAKSADSSAETAEPAAAVEPTTDPSVSDTGPSAGTQTHETGEAATATETPDLTSGGVADPAPEVDSASLEPAQGKLEAAPAAGSDDMASVTAADPAPGGAADADGASMAPEHDAAPVTEADQPAPSDPEPVPAAGSAESA